MSNLVQQALKNLALQLERVLLCDTNPRISMEAIRNFNVDLMHCQSEYGWCVLYKVNTRLCAAGFVMSTVSSYNCLRGSDASLAFEPLKQVPHRHTTFYLDLMPVFHSWWTCL